MYHTLDGQRRQYEARITWIYHPAFPGSRLDPTEPGFVEIHKIEVGDDIEDRRKEVEWLVEDETERLEQEAFEYIARMQEKLNHGGEYD